MLLEIFASMHFILFAPETLILSVIFCEASDKILALLFTNKNKQNQGQNDIWELSLMVCDWIKLSTSLNRVDIEMESLFFSLIIAPKIKAVWWLDGCKTANCF